MKKCKAFEKFVEEIDKPFDLRSYGNAWHSLFFLDRTRDRIVPERQTDLPVIVRPYLPARVSDDDYDDWSDNFAYNGTEL